MAKPRLHRVPRTLPVLIAMTLVILAHLNTVTGEGASVQPTFNLRDHVEHVNATGGSIYAPLSTIATLAAAGAITPTEAEALAAQAVIPTCNSALVDDDGAADPLGYADSCALETGGLVLLTSESLRRDVDAPGNTVKVHLGTRTFTDYIDGCCGSKNRDGDSQVNIQSDYYYTNYCRINNMQSATCDNELYVAVTAAESEIGVVMWDRDTNDDDVVDITAAAGKVAVLAVDFGGGTWTDHGAQCVTVNFGSWCTVGGTNADDPRGGDGDDGSLALRLTLN